MIAKIPAKKVSERGELFYVDLEGVGDFFPPLL